MANIVQFEDVGLRYPGSDRDTLSDVRFTLGSGGFYFLTGPSGAGKTSLLKLLYLAQRPTSGTIRIFGEDAGALPRARLPGFRRRIGVVFQDFRLVPHLSAFDNIALPLRLAGVPEGDVVEPVREMLAWVGLSQRIDATPQTLSGGEQQRIAIAGAVATSPQVLLADEPTAGLDLAGRDAVIENLRRAHELSGATVIIVTHDTTLAEALPRALGIAHGVVGSERRAGRRFAVAGRDGSVQLPAEIAARFPAGTVFDVRLEEGDVVRLRAELEPEAER
jgi:cell division transport system ATP-binding protein